VYCQIGSQISQLTAGPFLGGVPRMLTGERRYRGPAARTNGRRNPGQVTVAAAS
jgi:hypothetical protein